MRKTMCGSMVLLAWLLLGGCAPRDKAIEQHIDSSKVLVVIETELGAMTVALYPDKAPVTVANFLRHIDNGHYQAGQFYRSVRLDNQALSEVPIQVVQGGMGLPQDPDQKSESPYPAIAHETTQFSGLTHQDGALSMARFVPGSASSEFFIAVGDNASLDFGGARNPDGQGYAVFGQVIAGRDVLTMLHEQRSDRQVPAHLQDVQGQVLNAPVGFTIRRQPLPARSVP
ncbi:MAG: peptidylprolyl isomerase [Pseudomonadales bacterium]